MNARHDFPSVSPVSPDFRRRARLAQLPPAKKLAILREVEGHLEHNSEEVTQACLRHWRQLLQFNS